MTKSSYPAAEVVQLYVSYPSSTVERAERDLNGFPNFELDPEETDTIEIG